MTEYGKLVRDRIPEIVREDGERPVTSVAEGDEYADRLAAKLVEEAVEFDESRDVEELADVLAVVRAILDHEGRSIERVEELRREKRAERGGFGEGIVLERVEGADGE
ncbi:nucleoside triphosphate pyrophosphohydrolase [Salinilacihabitans rarus]|uniref:nucleoside triphosphate pyrophosphohydrolase n=1 Tax=Salinilacihabitans rarus TaxID=2961596 RepID=UPI0020C8D5A7|nr:nucleoside triphosphate pyrophosphohydrolase [Salinilacihabitans rarus]